MQLIYLAALFGSFAAALPASTVSLSLSLKDGDFAKHDLSTQGDECWRACLGKRPACPPYSVSTRCADERYRSESKLTNARSLKDPKKFGVSKSSTFDMISS